MSGVVAELLSTAFMAAGAASAAVLAGLAVAQAGRLWGLGLRFDACGLVAVGLLCALVAAVFATLLPGGGP